MMLHEIPASDDACDGTGNERCHVVVMSPAVSIKPLTGGCNHSLIVRRCSG